MDLSDFFRFLFKLGGSKDTLKRDVEFLKSRSRDLKQNLIPFSLQEAQLLSFSFSNIDGKIKSRNGIVGIIDTIYYEHLMVFAAKQYHTDYSLILVESKEDSFIFVFRNNKMQVFMNEVEAGNIDKNGTFYNKHGQAIAYWDWNASSPTQHVEIMGKKLGVINNSASKDVTTPRLFNLFVEPSEDEWSILLCLVLGKLIIGENAL